jgi:hypothetical protein
LSAVPAPPANDLHLHHLILLDDALYLNFHHLPQGTIEPKEEFSPFIPVGVCQLPPLPTVTVVFPEVILNGR